jgi:hypothetical protein
MPFYAAILALLVQLLLLFGPPRKGYLEEVRNDLRIIVDDRKLQIILLGVYVFIFSIVFLSMFFFMTISQS